MATTITSFTIITSKPHRLIMEILSQQPVHTMAQCLVQEEWVTNEQIVHYQAQSITRGISLIRCLIQDDIISSKNMACLLSRHFQLPYLDLDTFDPQHIPPALLHEPLLRHHTLLPLFEQDHKIHIAMDDPSQHASLQALQFYTKREALIVIVESDKLHTLLQQILQHKEHARLSHYFSNNPSITTTDDHQINQDTPVIQWINRLILDAIQQGASDLHFEPYLQSYRIRYRHDGLLHEVDAPPLHLAPHIATRIKIMANLDISERRHPQDGRFSIKTSSTDHMDCRVSTCPTLAGEKIVVRLLHTKSIFKQIDSLELDPEQKKLFLHTLARPQGMILVTGPTGSGKTMTLYAALHHLNTIDRNICTAEDPIEIHMHGINQVNISSDLTFAHLLRSFLRQDPDVMMIGEMRDRETAELALKAAQTGHLVLSTLHTNSAMQTITRLLGMGIPAYQIAHSVSLIIAQRLVRRLCTFCKILIEKDNIRHYRAQGCTHCDQGYRGRLPLWELMPVSIDIQKMLLSSQPTNLLLQHDQREGMSMLYKAGLDKVAEGLTTLDEIQRVTME